MTGCGRYHIGTHWGCPCVYDGAWLPSLLVCVHNTHTDAQAHADRLNTPHSRAQNVQQTALFNTQEA